jgi:hypothetical protein
MSDRRFLYLLKLAMGGVILIFGAHAIFFVLPEIWPLTRLPMYSEDATAQCPWFYSVVLDADGTIISPAELYNQAENEKDYYLASSLIGDAAHGATDRIQLLLDRVHTIVPHVEFVTVYLYRWSGDIIKFRQQVQSRNPDEKIKIGTIPGKVSLPGSVVSPSASCQPPFSDEVLFQ